MKNNYLLFLVFFVCNNNVSMEDELERIQNKDVRKVADAIIALQECKIKKLLTNTDIEIPFKVSELQTLKTISELSHKRLLEERNVFFNETRKQDFYKSLFSFTAIVPCCLFVSDPEVAPPSKNLGFFVGCSALYYGLDNMVKFLTNDSAHTHVFKALRIKQLIDYKIRCLESIQES